MPTRELSKHGVRDSRYDPRTWVEIVADALTVEELYLFFKRAREHRSWRARM